MSAWYPGKFLEGWLKKVKGQKIDLKKKIRDQLDEIFEKILDLQTDLRTAIRYMETLSPPPEAEIGELERMWKDLQAMYRRIYEIRGEYI